MTAPPSATRWIVEQLGRFVDYQPICPRWRSAWVRHVHRYAWWLGDTASRCRGRRPSIDVTDRLEGFALGLPPRNRCNQRFTSS